MEYLDILLYFGDLLLPWEACKGRDGTRKARDYLRSVCAAENEKSTVAKEEPKQAGEREGKIWIWIHSVSLISQNA